MTQKIISDNTKTMPFAPEVSVVVPAMNEEDGIAGAIATISAVLNSCAASWEIIVVDDGSRDGTYRRVCELSAQDSRIKGLCLSRNFGKEGAMLAGLQAARGQAVITMDADLQHPPRLIPEMLQKWRSGARIVHAVKRSRAQDSWAKRLAAYTVNKLISRLGGIDIRNSSDFKLLDRQIVDILVCDLRERVRFYRGLASWLGFQEESILFDVAERTENESKFSFKALAELSITALTSFTSAPLRLVAYLGAATLLLGVVVASDALWSWFEGRAVSGFATIIITILLIGSFIMMSLGVIGEYIAKIYEEIKCRPAYLIQATAGLDEHQRRRSEHDSQIRTLADQPPPGRNAA